MIAGPEPAWSADRANSMKKLQHPLKGVVEVLREAILRTDGESARNQMKRAVALHRANEKVQAEGVQALHRRLQSVSQGLRPSGIPSGAKIRDKSRLPEGDYADRSRLASCSSIDDVNSKRSGLQAAIRKRPRLPSCGFSVVFLHCRPRRCTPADRRATARMDAIVLIIVEFSF